MQEEDVTKMKVADLKRELKIRGLSVNGNKTELIERLQAALLDGNVDELDELDDTVLTDEDESNILGDDENELLQSPTTLKINVGNKDEDELLSPTEPKKVVLKRRTSFKETGSKTDTKQQSTEPKILKLSERKPITIGDSVDDRKVEALASTKSKVSQLSEKERLELRAKKFGQISAPASVGNKDTTNNNNSSSIGTVAADPDHLEKLKKRAERFGVVSPAVAKLDESEKLLKRKQRFGNVDPKSNTSEGSDVWAEKARLRLERFKTTPSTTVPIEEKP